MNKTPLGLRRLAKSLAWICCIWVAAGFLCPPAWADGPGRATGFKPPHIKKYAGTAEIVRVEKTDAANAKKGDATEGYEVWYTFKPKSSVPSGPGRDFLEKHKEHQFVLSSSGFCPGPKFLKKYGIKKGKKFAATLMVIKEDKSEPVRLEFKDVPNGDCFEAMSKP